MFKRKNNVILPPAKIGIIGGGQLGKMLAFEAKRMGYTVIILDPTQNCPAGQVADKQIVGSLHDSNEIRKLAELTDVVTYEFEFVNADVLCELESEGYKIYPSGSTLKKIQNKYIQKSVFSSAGLPVPRFTKINHIEDIEEGIKDFGFPLVLKHCTGGYDGKGNIVIKDKKDIENVKNDLLLEKYEMMIEEFVAFDRELSIVVARSFDGKITYFPVAENTHEDSILKLTKVPAKISDQVEYKIKDIAQKVLEVFDDIGIFCIEIFLTANGEVYINEVAPRPHNSAHYTIEACITSQFEQQLRAITGMPLGSTKLMSPAVMVNVLGKQPIYGEYSVKGVGRILEEEGVYLHFYGKQFVDVKKKIGHITVLDDSLEKAEEKSIIALENLLIEPIKEEI
ncbi:N5-carboxyaminoimidazole ribonucleotide synthase [Clostridium polyendosporum]|uniref:N5-carboxyaminoimidazole ribonucleotide synthase n=1 Tax=Clostridium polyendosporum TaxID=69208 RepID=A0A919S0Y6_9CLOT|nr:5-(carboxyamino)imidazole ribonucleotide synthase [Clostridium polyendosporum]GIM29155.1 N5-carboxyaminoimidazole ribonucleotide synthase [Clostridium polyendosporum]